MSSKMLLQLAVILLFLLMSACSFESDCECQVFSTKRISKRSATCREKYTIEIIEGWILPSDNDCHFLNPDRYSTNVTDELRTRCDGINECSIHDIVAKSCYTCVLNVHLCCVLEEIATNSGQTTQNITSLFTSENKITTELQETKFAMFSISTPRTESIALTSKVITKDIPSFHKTSLASKDITKDISRSHKSTLTSKAITKDISRFHKATLVTSTQNNGIITNTSKSTSRKPIRNSYYTKLSASTAVPYYTTVSRKNQPIKSTISVGTIIGVAIGVVFVISTIVVLLIRRVYLKSKNNSVMHKTSNGNFSKTRSTDIFSTTL